MKKLLSFCTFFVSLTFSVSTPAWCNDIAIGPGNLPGWHAKSQVQLGWDFADPTNPQMSDLLPGWDDANPTPCPDWFEGHAT